MKGGLKEQKRNILDKIIGRDGNPEELKRRLEERGEKESSRENDKEGEEKGVRNASKGARESCRRFKYHKSYINRIRL